MPPGWHAVWLVVGFLRPSLALIAVARHRLKPVGPSELARATGAVARHRLKPVGPSVPPRAVCEECHQLTLVVMPTRPMYMYTRA